MLSTTPGTRALLRRGLRSTCLPTQLHRTMAAQPESAVPSRGEKPVCMRGQLQDTPSTLQLSAPARTAKLRSARLPCARSGAEPHPAVTH